MRVWYQLRSDWLTDFQSKQNALKCRSSDFHDPVENLFCSAHFLHNSVSLALKIGVAVPTTASSEVEQDWDLYSMCSANCKRLSNLHHLLHLAVAVERRLGRKKASHDVRGRPRKWKPFQFLFLVAATRLRLQTRRKRVWSNRALHRGLGRMSIWPLCQKPRRVQQWTGLLFQRPMSHGQRPM